MSFWKNLIDAVQHDEEVTHFVPYNRGYYVILHSGRRLDITRVLTLQPSIQDFDDYNSFMFIETIQGFFLMRQRVVKNAVQHWELVLELIPAVPATFFSDVEQHWNEVRRREDLRGGWMRKASFGG